MNTFDSKSSSEIVIEVKMHFFFENALWAVAVSVIASVSAVCGLTAINVTVNNMLPQEMYLAPF